MLSGQWPLRAGLPSSLPGGGMTWSVAHSVLRTWPRPIPTCLSPAGPWLRDSHTPRTPASPLSSPLPPRSEPSHLLILLPQRSSCRWSRALCGPCIGTSAPGSPTFRPVEHPTQTAPTPPPPRASPALALVLFLMLRCAKQPLALPFPTRFQLHLRAWSQTVPRSGAQHLHAVGGLSQGL